MGLMSRCSSVIARKQLLYIGKISDLEQNTAIRWDSCEHRNDERWADSKAMPNLVLVALQ